MQDLSLLLVNAPFIFIQLQPSSLLTGRDKEKESVNEAREWVLARTKQ